MSESKVSERLYWLRNKEVRVAVATWETKEALEYFDARYEDVVPLGREYFFIFVVKGSRRLIRTTSVIEIQEKA
jgi:hypothetical protein